MWDIPNIMSGRVQVVGSNMCLYNLSIFLFLASKLVTLIWAVRVTVTPSKQQKIQTCDLNILLKTFWAIQVYHTIHSSVTKFLGTSIFKDKTFLQACSLYNSFNPWKKVTCMGGQHVLPFLYVDTESISTGELRTINQY